MSGETPRKHHYIPVFYLRQWAGADGKVCEHRKVLPGKVVTRRAAPESTGYLKDLYRVDAPDDVISPEIESTFMKLVDTGANLAMQEFLRHCGSGQPIALTGQARSDWTRFLLSLVYRNPETVKLIKGQMMGVWAASLEDMRANYVPGQYAGDPPTFEEYLDERASPEMPQRAALKLLMSVIDSKRVAPTIRNMHWGLASLARSEVSLLTSDRPLDKPHRLDNRDAYIALPLGPKLLFIAAHDDRYQRHVASADATRLVKELNRPVVEFAREFVWGFDDGHLRFVCNRMGRSPERPILTDKQRQQAIDAALAGAAAFRGSSG